MLVGDRVEAVRVEGCPLDRAAFSCGIQGGGEEDGSVWVLIQGSEGG